MHLDHVAGRQRRGDRAARGQLGARSAGRYLTYDTGTRHHRLLVSILNMMGVPDDTIGGSWDDGSGPLPGL